jgi:transcriptional regulator with GAF, ATPase, and Fis domain
MADHGALFLDEVGDLSPAAQAKLLRVLQDMSVERVGGQSARSVDTRVVAATNRTLQSMVESGRVRADLYYRVAGVEVYVPPLRARREDVPLLVEYFTARHRRVRHVSIAPSAIEALTLYDWPGNVRQLARVLERAVALAPHPLIGYDRRLKSRTNTAITSRRRSATIRCGPDQPIRSPGAERCDGNKRRACELLAISYHTLRSHGYPDRGLARHADAFSDTGDGLSP